MTRPCRARGCLGDRDDQLYAGLGRLEDRVGGKGAGTKIRLQTSAPVSFTASLTVSKTGMAVDSLPPLPGVDAGDDLGAVLDICCVWNGPARPMPWQTTLVSLVDQMLIVLLLALRGRDGLVRGLVERRGGLDREAGVGEDLTAFSTLVPSRRTTSGMLQPDLLRRVRRRPRR
jgi:hypothetical protein